MTEIAPSSSIVNETLNTNSTMLMVDDSLTLTAPSIREPLNDQLSRSTDDIIQDAKTLSHKKSETFATTLPYILKFDDDFVGSCLDLVYGSQDQTITLCTTAKDADDRPLLPEKIVTTTTTTTTTIPSSSINNNLNLVLAEKAGDLHSNNIDANSLQQNEIITPPSSPAPPPIDDEIEEEAYALFSPPPSAKSLTTEFYPFANVITPAFESTTSTKYEAISIHESTLHGSSHQSLYSRASGSTGSITINNDISQLDLHQDHLQQPLPPLPHHDQQQQPDSLQDQELPSLPQHLHQLHQYGSQEKHELNRATSLSSFTPIPSDLPPKDVSNQTGLYAKVSPVEDNIMNDGDYYPDSSLYAASITEPAPNPVSLKSYHPVFPPITLENLHQFRQEAQSMPDDLELQLNFAKYLMEAVEHVWIDDPTRSVKAKTAMLSEAQRIVKTLALKSKIGRLGYAEAQFYLANAYGAGLMLLRLSHEKAFGLYLQGSKQCHAESTYRVGVCYELGLGTRKDYARAIRFYRKAAKLGDPSAMYKLATVLLHGLLGQDYHPKEAISWLKRAVPLADPSHPEILHELGLAYEADKGIPSVIPDQEYAGELFTKAARLGYAPSQYKVGLAYENANWNHPVDPRRSIAWYSKAADQGHMESVLALSGWYLTGATGPGGYPILPQDDTEAYLWARKAADRGYAKAEYACGYYSETGIGVAQNWIDAYQWYERAAKQRYAKAISRLAELKIASQQKRMHSSYVPRQQQQQQQQQSTKRDQHRRSLSAIAETRTCSAENNNGSNCQIM